jgi:hypothetical protein
MQAKYQRLIYELSRQRDVLGGARWKFLTMAGDFGRLKGQCHEIFCFWFFS